MTTGKILKNLTELSGRKMGWLMGALILSMDSIFFRQYLCVLIILKTTYFRVKYIMEGDSDDIMDGDSGSDVEGCSYYRMQGDTEHSTRLL